MVPLGGVDAGTAEVRLLGWRFFAIRDSFESQDRRRICTGREDRKELTIELRTSPNIACSLKRPQCCFARVAHYDYSVIITQVHQGLKYLNI